MSGYTNDEKSLATGIPDRTISPETGSFGNATKTNTGDTSEGTNQDHESAPPPAAGLGASDLTTTDVGEHHGGSMGEQRSFQPGGMGSAGVDLPEAGGAEPVYQQIADGGDRFDHDKRLHGTEADKDDERLERERFERDRLDL